VKERLHFLADAPAVMKYLYGIPVFPAIAEFLPKKLDATGAVKMLEECATLLGSLDLADIPAAEEIFRARAAAIGAKLGDLLMPLRVAITGSRVSPPLFESMRLLGRDESLTRIGLAIAHIRTAPSLPPAQQETNTAAAVLGSAGGRA
jgi:glutamyl-tRNA synthetase